MTDQPTSSQRLSSFNKRRVAFAAQCLAGAALLGGAFLLSGMAERPVEAEQVPASAIYGGEFSHGTTGNYLAGRYAANVGDFDRARQYLTRTLMQEADNNELAGYVYRMYLITGDMDNAVNMAHSLYEAADPESSPEIMVLLSRVKKGDYAEARTVMQAFDQTGFNLVILPLVGAWLDFAEGKLTKPVQQAEALKQVTEFAPFIHYQTALINDIAGFEEEAITQYNAALEKSRTMPYRVVEMLANLHARRGEWDKAQELYARYRSENPDSMLIEPELKQMAAKGEAPARLVSNAREGLAEIFFSTASILHNEKLNEEALIYLQQVLYLNPDFTAARLMRGTVYEDLGSYEEALAEYSSLPKDTSYYYKGQLRKAYTLHSMKDNEAALALLGDLARQVPDRYQVLLTRGDILMRAKRYNEAVEAYSAALERIGSTQPDHWPVFYARGICYERISQWELAEKDLLKALAMEPGQPDVLNYLGYSWLTQNMRVAEAKQMIEQAVKARPTDAHIIDSMGWALYTMGDYEGSIDYLERAIELMPTDPTVNDHLGDAYWRMGRHNEARFQWKRALLFNPETGQAEQLTAKLDGGLPPADQVQTAEREDKIQRAEVRQN